MQGLASRRISCGSPPLVVNPHTYALLSYTQLRLLMLFPFITGTAREITRQNNVDGRTGHGAGNRLQQRERL